MGQLFAATTILSYKVFFFTCYSMGLRLGEGIRLTVGDIDAGKMRVHIRDAKGNKDRLVPLPDKTLCGAAGVLGRAQASPISLSQQEKRSEKRPPG